MSSACLSVCTALHPRILRAWLTQAPTGLKLEPNCPDFRLLRTFSGRHFIRSSILNTSSWTRHHGGAAVQPHATPQIPRPPWPIWQTPLALPPPLLLSPVRLRYPLRPLIKAPSPRTMSRGNENVRSHHHRIGPHRHQTYPLTHAAILPTHRSKAPPLRLPQRGAVQNVDA